MRGKLPAELTTDGPAEPVADAIARIREAAGYARRQDGTSPPAPSGVTRPPLIFDGRISLIINTANEGPRLKATVLDFIDNLTGNDVELIVVADGVTDGCCDDLPEGVTVIRVPEPAGCGQAKLLGVAASTGDVLLFADAHHKVLRGRLAKLAVEAAKAPSIVCPTGRNIGYTDDWEPYAAHGDIIIPADRAYLWNRKPYTNVRATGCGVRATDGVYCVTCMTRETYDAIGGWNAYRGRHGGQEGGIAYRAHGAGIPIKLAGCVCVGHEFRKRFPYEIIPTYHGTRQNLWHMHFVLFGAEVFAKTVAPYLDKIQNARIGKAVIEDPDVIAERDHYVADCRKLSDAEMLELCEIPHAGGFRLRCEVPYLPGQRLGDAYNRIMDRADKDDWVLLLDHDVGLVNPQWYAACRRAVEANPKAGLFTCRTNRIRCAKQLDEDAPEGDDWISHEHHAFARSKARKGEYTDPGRSLISGFFMLTSKAAWEKAGGFRKGFLGVDNDYHQRVTRAGFDVRVIEELYCYHRKVTTGGP